MKAVRLHDYGPPEALVYEDAPEPVPAAGELLIAIGAVGVNPADYKFRNGSLAAHFPKPMPLILGMDVAGEVIGVGRDAVDFKPGDSVFAMIPHTHMGGYAEYVAAPARFFARRPEGLDAITAAALGTPGTTGVELIEDDLDIRPGQRVLVTGAAGAVGRAAVFAAKRRGAHVTAAVRADRRHGVPAQADALLIVDDGMEQAACAPFDAIADTVGGATANALLRLLRSGGLLSSVSTVPVGDTGGRDVISRRFACRPDPARLNALAEAVARDEITFPPITTLTLAEAAAAHRLIEGGRAGKIVLIVGSNASPQA